MEMNVSGGEMEVENSFKQQIYTNTWSKLQLFLNSQVWKWLWQQYQHKLTDESIFADDPYTGDCS